jgi:hypothetical protein
LTSDFFIFICFSAAYSPWNFLCFNLNLIQLNAKMALETALRLFVFSRGKFDGLPYRYLCSEKAVYLSSSKKLT